MRIIQVVGRSNSGKTTFIKALIPELKKIGKVAAIKHLGDHEYHLEDGKDTTGFHDAGADFTIGIDSAKSVIAVRTNSLDTMLELLMQQGMDFVVIEGFKTNPFPKIVIGNLTIDNCILQNPDTTTVLSSLDQFAEYSGLPADKR